MKRELIVKYIVGDADLHERQLVETWAAQHSDHGKELEEMKKVWDFGQEHDHAPEIDIDHVWKDFVRMRDALDHRIVPPDSGGHRKIWYWIRIAASLLVVGTLALWGLQTGLRVERSLKSDIRVQHATLPDGSTVHLNSYAEMRYKKDWLDRDRKVELYKGEVFFDVKKDPGHPFVIGSGQSKIMVLGTSFHVRRAGNDTEVIVASGSVKVVHGGQEIVLKPDQMIVVSDTATRKMRIDTVPDQLYRYYVHQEFVFENTPLSRVFDVLSKAYNQKFEIGDVRIKTLQYTATFEQQNLHEILDVISRTFDLSINKKENVYYIN